MTTPPDFATAYAGRLLADAWIDATARQWRKRAADFEWVLTGVRGATPTAEQLARRPDIAAVIEACRNRASHPDLTHDEYIETLTVVALEAAA